MMQCHHYRKVQKLQESRDLQADRQSRGEIETRPYCDHSHSPVDKSAATKTAFGGTLLKCSGDLSKCQVDAEYRPTSDG